MKVEEIGENRNGERKTRGKEADVKEKGKREDMLEGGSEKRTKIEKRERKKREKA